jgi:histidinol-phosphate/aromatic aminotransferase/cobyric acid decarboxylase-like protein
MSSATRARASDVGPLREALVAALSEAGFDCVPSSAPFVLIDTSPAGRTSVREALAARGFAVRRCETFPGLGPTWIRVAVRDRTTSQALATALAALKENR